jgi:hypothetical protein
MAIGPDSGDFKSKPTITQQVPTSLGNETRFTRTPSKGGLFVGSWYHFDINHNDPGSVVTGYNEYQEYPLIMPTFPDGEIIDEVIDDSISIVWSSTVASSSYGKGGRYGDIPFNYGGIPKIIEDFGESPPVTTYNDSGAKRLVVGQSFSKGHSGNASTYVTIGWKSQIGLGKTRYPAIGQSYIQSSRLSFEITNNSDKIGTIIVTSSKSEKQKKLSGIAAVDPIITILEGESIYSYTLTILPGEKKTVRAATLSAGLIGFEELVHEYLYIWSASMKQGASIAFKLQALT